MSEHDDTLLDEDLGDEEYDLGNDEEEALLADDYEVERQNSYKGEEETDDVLDLGVTDALDDLEAEDENIEFSRGKTDMHNKHDFYNEGEQQDGESSFYKQQQEGANVEYEGEEQDTANTIGKGDLREKLQKNVQKVYVGNGQGLEDDDGEEARERRNRFQSERTMISPKMNNDIPDSLENVVTSEPSKPVFRGRGRGRGIRGSKGGRFIPQNSGNFNPRFSNARNTPFDNQQQICRPPLLEARPPFLLGVPNSMQNQQIIYQQNNPQVQAFQQFSSNTPLQGPAHFMDNRPQFNPNQFQGPLGPRTVGPRLDFGPRGPIAGPIQGSPFNCAPNQPFNVQIQAAPFQNQGAIMPDNPPPRHMQGSQPPLLHSGSSTGGSLLGTPTPMASGNSAVMLQNNQMLPLQGNQAVPIQDFPRPQAPNQGPPIQNHPNVHMPNQSTFENRPPFQDQHFENRPYDSRPGYSDQITNSQFNTNNVLPVSQQSCSNIPNVSLPPGHKILINPHFRGTVQPTNETARLPWDPTQHPAQIGQTQITGSQFTPNSISYQNQNPYSQSQQSSAQYQQNYQQNKSDDPYAYFSDVWQENKPQKTQSSGLNKQYSSESSYLRDSNYSESKYKSDSQWEQRDSYQEESYRGSHPNYRDRELSCRSRSDYSQKTRPPSSSTYRNDSYDQNHIQKSSSSKSMSSTARGTSIKLPQKRTSDTSDRTTEDSSPKKSKPSGRHFQEVRTVDSLNERTEDKKDEEDPEMQEYRKKMEEQKRLREKILREKENRRKMAALEKQNEENKTESSGSAGSEGSQQEAKPVSVLLGVMKDAAANKGRPGVGRGRGRPVNAQTAEGTERAPGTRIIRTIQTIKSNDSTSPDNIEEKNNKGIVSGQTSDKSTSRQMNPQTGSRRVVIQKPLNSQKIATTIQKTVSNLQKGQVSAQSTVQKIVQTQTGNLKKAQVAQKIANNAQRMVAPKVVVNTQSNQRVVLQKVTVPMKKTSEVKTNTVKLENLAASTSEAQIRRMCQGIGTIESIQMGEGNATIVFKTQSAAMVFHKKYQRKMLDLSLITVRLVPQTNVNKSTIAAVAKKS